MTKHKHLLFSNIYIFSFYDSKSTFHALRPEYANIRLNVTLSVTFSAVNSLFLPFSSIIDGTNVAVKFIPSICIIPAVLPFISVIAPLNCLSPAILPLFSCNIWLYDIIGLPLLDNEYTSRKDILLIHAGTISLHRAICFTTSTAEDKPLSI